MSMAVFYLLSSCKYQTTIESNPVIEKPAIPSNNHGIHCTEQACEGTYVGPEFVNGSDVAHQFSNHMSKEVGDKLKEFYKQGKFRKVDFEHIQMSTKGMGSGSVRYFLHVPFITVKSRCEAYTSFDHVGGWDHAPALERRKKELQHVKLPNEMLDISALKKTPEGLEEYWIQWKNKVIQKECE